MKNFSKLLILFGVSILSCNSQANEICFSLEGATILAQDDTNTYLGKIESPFSSDSIFNEFGDYGSEFSDVSVFNEFSDFGSEFSSYSATDEFTSTPPIIIKNGKIIAYLTTNEFIAPGISPNLLKALCEKVL